ncbi:MAG TPA: hypothetical protein VLA97_16585 [Nocardioidaceae bacterium]|nr:hypothetical protein [Nocardioidaceae bacterium]
MTTEPGAAAGSAWRGGCTEPAAKRLGVAVGCVTLLPATSVAALLLHNLYGPLGDSPSAGTAAALGSGACAGVAAVVGTRWLARRSRSLLVVVLAASAVAGWVLFPRQIDVTESWVPQPNERYSCTGWTFRYYPPGTFDAAATTYCVGVEHRIPDG